MSNCKEVLKQQSSVIEEYLQHCLNQKDIPNGLRVAMEYSLHAGGKRIRPVLFLSVLSLFGQESKKFLSFAAAIECIHTYSLIHDDLPAMDDDDLRRGKPSSHKKFNEATAILAGDALLTDAFSFMTQVPAKAENVLSAIQFLATAAGSKGMVGGQFLDIQYTDSSELIGYDELAKMHAMKTGALLTAPCVCAAILAGASAKDQKNMADYGAALGAAFQITDDILDEIGNEADLGKPVGSDISQNKVTYLSLFGLEKSKILAQEKSSLAISSLSAYTTVEAEFLRNLSTYVVTRAS